MNNRLPKRQYGFSFIEILISVLVFGIGILGLGGLQIASLKGSSNAHYRTTASVLAMDIADRIRLNPNAVSDGRYGKTVSCSTVSRLCRSSACSTDELAVFDIQEVMCGSRVGSGKKMRRLGGVVGLLPNGAMTITCVGGCGQPKATHDITVSWNKQKTDHRSTLDQGQSLIISVIP